LPSSLLVRKACIGGLDQDPGLVRSCTPEQSETPVELCFLLLITVVEVFVEDGDQKIREEKWRIKPKVSLRREATKRENVDLQVHLTEVVSWKEE
jgi:hypothetical protein